MAWTDPADHDYTTNEVVTASTLDTYVKDNLLALLHPFHAENTPISITNTTNQTSLFTSAPVIPGGDMGATGRIRAELRGSYIVNAASRVITIRVKFGGSTVLTLSTIDAGESASTFYWSMMVDIYNTTSASVQYCHAMLHGEAASSSAFEIHKEAGGTAAVATASDQTFDISGEWDAASASVTWTKTVSRVYIAQA